jgi:Ca2+-binding EF-hand superfamily protein
MSNIEEEMRANFRVMFDDLDTDKSGSLEGDEVAAFLKEAQFPVDMAKILFPLYDRNKDGKLQFEEFLSFFEEFLDVSFGNPAPLCTSIFKAVDTDNSGTVNAKELADFMKKYDFDLLGDLTSELGSGEVTLDQWLEIVSKASPSE